VKHSAPESFEDSDREIADFLTEIAEDKEKVRVNRWKIAIGVVSWTHRGKDNGVHMVAGPGHHERYSFREYADLAKHGLTNHQSVSWYWWAWHSIDGPELNPGDSPEIPKNAFPSRDKTDDHRKKFLAKEVAKKEAERIASPEVQASIKQAAKTNAQVNYIFSQQSPAEKALKEMIPHPATYHVKEFLYHLRLATKALRDEPGMNPEQREGFEFAKLALIAEFSNFLEAVPLDQLSENDIQFLTDNSSD